MNYFGSIFAMVVCIAMSAYFSATETAFSSLNKTRLKVLADNGNKRAALALKLSEDYDKLISTILIGNNIVNIMVASIGTLLFVGLYGDIGATVSTVVVTIVVLIFGEITPKSIAKDTPERFALFSAPFIRLWIWVLTPLNFLFSQWKRLVSRFFKTDDDTKMSELLRNALEFRDLTAAEILTHRIDLEAVNIDESHEEIARAFTQSSFSRLLVYRDTIDQIVGVLHQKDFYINGKMTDQPITEIMTEPLFVYQHTKIRDVLKMLQHKKSHVAVVVDDFGGTLGIVTMEDILEELVGEIIGTTVNTLLFAYLGGSILLFAYVQTQQYNLEIILNSKFLFQDVAIMLSGAIACLFTVPVSIRCVIRQIHHAATETDHS